MNAGELRELWTVEAWDGATWAALGEAYFEVTQVSSANDGAGVTHAVRGRNSGIGAQIRAASDLHPTHQLVSGSRVLDILDVIRVGRRKDELQMQCREVLAPPA